MNPTSNPESNIIPANNAASPQAHPSLPLVVGLTGGIGSGKTQVSQRLQQLGVTIIDTDHIAHALTAPNGAAMPAIDLAFGSQVLNPDGSLNRAYMRQLILSEPSHKKTLENILHPAIRQAVQSQLHTLANLKTQSIKTMPYVVLVVPLLFEHPMWQTICWQIVVVDCPPQLQIERVQARNKWPVQDIHAMLAQQTSREVRLAGAQHIINNQGSLADLHQQVDALHAQLLLQAASI